MEAASLEGMSRGNHEDSVNPKGRKAKDAAHGAR